LSAYVLVLLSLQRHSHYFFCFSPKYLILHLKRFIFVEKPIPTDQENAPPNSPSSRPPVEYVFRKNKTPVKLVNQLSLEAFCSEPPLQDYRLRSLVHHIGGSASSGHYTADAIRPYRSVAPPTPDESTPASPADTPSSTTLGAPATNDKGAAAKEPEEEWITFDDSNSCKTTLDKIQASKFKSQTAYMLLYSLDE
jgi:ubiquitin C-terminal hydrolase